MEGEWPMAAPLTLLLRHKRKKRINMLKVYNRIHPTLYKVMNHSNNIQMRVK